MQKCVANQARTLTAALWRDWKRMHGLDWDDLKVVMSVAAEGSVRRAAVSLCKHHTTVTRRLDQLEKRLGVVLFDRTATGLQLNEHGMSVVAHAQRVAAEVEDLERNLLGLDQRLEGRVRLTLPEVVASQLLMTELAQFCDQHPEITLEFVPPHEALDIRKRDADVAVRVTDRPPEHLVGRSLGRFAVAPYVHRSASEPHGWIGAGSGDGVDADWHDRFCPGAPVVMRCKNLAVRLAAVQAAAGAAILPCALADPHDEIRRLTVSAPLDGGEIWLLTHPDLRKAARVRALMTHLTEVFAQQQDVLLGCLPDVRSKRAGVG
jgi:DNA-binding transcriptional LysR family regulator